MEVRGKPKCKGSQAKDTRQDGLKITRVFTQPGQDPFDTIAWARRTSRITNTDGSIVFEMQDAEIPAPWSQVATDIMVSKYFRKAGAPQFDAAGSPVLAQNGEPVLGPERSARQVISRLASTWRHWGEHHRYFASTEDAQAVEDDLVNPGGIFDLVTREARVFKYGSGSGSNFSRLRAEGERLSGGGTSSGLMSFLKIFDRAAGAIKSGGTTRRAAKMVVVDIDHPDIEKFIAWKAEEEKKVAALIAAGYSSDFNGEAYATVSGQNSNNSVRVSEGFL